MKNLISRSAKRDQRGFTLIELLVVVAIIAILAALILAALNAAQKGARDSRRQSNINQFKTALANYYSDHQSYPEYNGQVGTDTEPCSALEPNYVSAGCTLVTDPDPTTYFYNSDGSTFTICAVEERDAEKAYMAGPTTTTTSPAIAGGFKASDCTGVD